MVNRATHDSDGVEYEHARPFADFLREQARGLSHQELSEGLHDLVERVQDTGKKGQMTYVLTVEPTKGMAAALTVSDKITLKLPEHDRQASLFFRDRSGNLVRNDPNQPDLGGPLRDVSALEEATEADLREARGQG